MIPYYPNSFGKKFFRQQKKRRQGNKFDALASGSQDSEDSSTLSTSTELNREEDFTHSCDAATGRNYGNSALENNKLFAQSVVVVPTSSNGEKYTVYPRNVMPPLTSLEISDFTRESFLESMKFDHNISNAELRRQRFENDLESTMRKNSILSKGSRQPINSDSDNRSKSGSFHSEDCQCGKYHCHKFKTQTYDTLQYSRPVRPIPVERQSQDVAIGNENQMTICNIFWNAQLNFCGYKYGDKVIDFQSLWPQEVSIKSLLHDGVQELGLRGALWELVHLVMVAGPVSVLKLLLDENIIRKYSAFKMLIIIALI